MLAQLREHKLTFFSSKEGFDQHRGKQRSHEILVYSTSVIPGGEGSLRQAQVNDYTQPTQIPVMGII